MLFYDAFVFWNPWWAGEKDWLKAHERDGLLLLKPLFGRKEILTISGVRRSGKTTILHLLIKLLLEESIPAPNILHLNLEDPAFKDSSLYDLYEKYLAFMNPFGKVYLFLDEVQEIEGWQKDLRKLYDGVRDLKIVVTGSNSSLLKGDYATLLTGRTIPYEVYPFSFREIVKQRGILNDFTPPAVIRKKTRIQHAFSEYLLHGGFPEVVNEENTKLKTALLKEYYNGILTRDVIRRYAIRRTKQYEKAAHFLMSNATALFSLKKLSGLLDVNVHTLEDYIGYLEDVYLLFGVNHFSYSLKQQITYPRKAYCVDNGFINAVSFKFSEDAGRLLENAVFAGLKTAGLEFYYWKGKKECDFIVKTGGTVSDAIQVCYSLKDAGTRKREIDGLLEAMREFNLEKGAILTHDESEIIDAAGGKIEIVPVWQWLLR
ncbi:MAG: ATP-binding protein [Desulfosalsimonadaceae bacterium]|nr:ATP-binding protein [Desulfosalsimonadaceae bacterium]